MNAKDFQDLLKESESILRDEDFAPKGAEEITRERMSPEREDSNSSIISLLDEVIQSAEEIIDRAKVCQQAVESGDSEYMKDIEDLESVIGGNTADLTYSMSEIMDAINDAEEDDEEDDEYMRESVQKPKKKKLDEYNKAMEDFYYKGSQTLNPSQRESPYEEENIKLAIRAIKAGIVDIQHILPAIKDKVAEELGVCPKTGKPLK